VRAAQRALWAVALVSGAGLGAARADEWTLYEAREYGFAMLVPEGATLREREYGGGWAGLYGESEGVELFGLARLGEPASAEEIERFAVEATGIDDDAWEEVDSGSGGGWRWYRTVRARSGGRVIYGGYGTGPRGSYLLLVRAPASDFDAARADFEHWYESVRLF
jgi:hypothetical protein